MIFIDVPYLILFSTMQSNDPPRPSRQSGLKPVADFVSVDGLARRARWLDELDYRLRCLLPAAVATECRLGDVRDRRLVFLANGGSWAARLRLHETALLAEARVACGERIDRLVVKVATATIVPRDPPAVEPLSPAAGQHLLAAAESTRDPEIEALYRKLAALARS